MSNASSASCRSFVPDPCRFDSDGQRSDSHSFRRQRGFSLVEILIVIAIIGVLAGIAIPQFITYRSKGIDTQMKSDLRNAAVAMEGYFETNKVYPSSVAAISTLDFQGTAGVALTLTNVTANSYELTAAKSGGTQASFMFDSSTGSIQ